MDSRQHNKTDAGDKRKAAGKNMCQSYGEKGVSHAKQIQKNMQLLKSIGIRPTKAATYVKRAEITTLNPKP